MERLTEEKQIGPFASLKDKAEAKPGAFRDYDCLYAHMVAVTRLKAYEDTGMEPEEIIALAKGALKSATVDVGTKLYDLAVSNVFEKRYGITLDRMCELAQADKDGRCVVMPCKVGCKIWTIENVFNGKETVQTLGSRVIDEIKHNKLNENTMISKRPFELHFYPSEVGKTVFLTRESAEKALEALHDPHCN